MSELTDNERARLEAAERVCAAFGWTAVRFDADPDLAVTELWMRWADLNDRTTPRDWPDIDIAALAATRRAKRKATLACIGEVAEPTP